MRETRKIVTRFYVGFSNAQLVPTHVCFVDLLNSHPLSRSLDSFTDESATLLGVGEVLAMKDFEFPVFFGKSDNEDSFVGERDSRDGGCDTLALHNGYMLLSEGT